MHNLLCDNLSHEALTDIFRRHHRPRAVLPLCSDSRWEKALATQGLSALKETLIRRAYEESDQPLPPLTDELYREFSETGDRVHFENHYFERRRRFARAAFALLASGGKPDSVIHKSFLDKLVALLDEPSWALPAHVSDPSGKDPQVIDLFAAETASLMAEISTTFPTLIPEDIQGHIRRRLHEGVFQVYLEKTFFWMDRTSNWNAVCHQGVLGAALTMDVDPELLASLFEKASPRLALFLQGFGEDGACSEGPAYWEYGFGRFATLNEQLEAASDGQLSLFSGDPRIAKIASYGPAMTLSNGRCIPFSDCPTDFMLRPSVLNYLGRRLELESCLTLARQNYARLIAVAPECDSERADWFYYTRLFLEASEMEGSDSGGKSTMAIPDNVYYPSLGVWVSHERDNKRHLWEIAAKGGHNEEHHNHNDVGNFIVTIDGVPLLVEMGRSEYTAAYFSAVRYTFPAARSLGHSLPVIHHNEQVPGWDFRGIVLRADIEGPVQRFEVDLTQTYSPAAFCRRYLRRLLWTPAEGYLQVHEQIELSCPGPVACGYIAGDGQVAILSPTLAEITKEGLTLRLQVSGSGTWQGVELLHDRNRNAVPRTTQRLVLAASSVTEFNAILDITLA